MTCSLNSPLREDTLTAAIDGHIDDETRAHLAQCPACRARFEAAQAVEHSLHNRLYRFDCPSSQELADYHLGFVAITDSARDRAIIHHLESCQSCVAEIETLRLFLNDAPVAESAPHRAPQPQRSALGDVFARLLPRSPQMALRGAASATISAEIDDVTLLFDPQPGPQGVTLHGQLLALDTEQFEGATVAALAGDLVLAETTVDDLGSFELGPLQSGLVNIRLAPADGPAIWVQSVELD